MWRLLSLCTICSLMMYNIAGKAIQLELRRLVRYDVQAERRRLSEQRRLAEKVDPELFARDSKNVKSVYNTSTTSNTTTSIAYSSILRNITSHPQNSNAFVHYRESLDMQMVPLGLGLGTHYVEIYIGNGSQKASAVIDTGSDYTAFPCKECGDNCGKHIEEFYNPDLSPYSKRMPCDWKKECACIDDHCQITQGYSDGSQWKANMIEERVWLGGINISSSPLYQEYVVDRFMKDYGIQYVIGCQVSLKGLFERQKANGIIGLSRGKNTFMDALYENHKIDRNLFSICFHAEGGTMVLGGVDHGRHLSPVRYTFMDVGLWSKSKWYNVYIMDLMVGNKSLGVAADDLNSGKGIVIDSGTTDTFFPKAAAEPFMKLFKEQSGIEYRSDRPLDIPLDKLIDLPNLQVVIEDEQENPFTLSIPPTQYLDYVGDGKFVGNFHFTEYSGGVLGASLLMNWDVIFDRKHNRIGFAAANCSQQYKTQLYVPPDMEQAFSQIQEVIHSHPGFVLFGLLLITFGIFIFSVCFMYRMVVRRRWSRSDDPLEKTGLTAAMSSRTKGPTSNAFTIEDEEGDDEDDEEKKNKNSDDEEAMKKTEEV